MDEFEFMGVEPHVEQSLSHIAVDALLDGVVVRDVGAFFHFAQHLEDPCAVGVEVVPGHDEHVAGHQPVVVHHDLCKSWMYSGNCCSISFFSE